MQCNWQGIHLYMHENGPKLENDDIVVLKQVDAVFCICNYQKMFHEKAAKSCEPKSYKLARYIYFTGKYKVVISHDKKLWTLQVHGRHWIINWYIDAIKNTFLICIHWGTKCQMLISCKKVGERLRTFWKTRVSTKPRFLVYNITK